MYLVMNVFITHKRKVNVHDRLDVLKEYVDALDYIVEQPFSKPVFEYNPPSVAPVKVLNVW